MVTAFLLAAKQAVMSKSSMISALRRRYQSPYRIAYARVAHFIFVAAGNRNYIVIMLPLLENLINGMINQALF